MSSYQAKYSGNYLSTTARIRNATQLPKQPYTHVCHKQRFERSLPSPIILLANAAECNLKFSWQIL